MAPGRTRNPASPQFASRLPALSVQASIAITDQHGPWCALGSTFHVKHRRAARPHDRHRPSRPLYPPAQMGSVRRTPKQVYDTSTRRPPSLVRTHLPAKTHLDGTDPICSDTRSKIASKSTPSRRDDRRQRTGLLSEPMKRSEQTLNRRSTDSPRRVSRETPLDGHAKCRR